MVLTRPQKEAQIQETSERLAKSPAVILVNYQGMLGSQLEKLRRGLRQDGIDFKIIKNTLFKKSLEAAKLTIDQEIFTKPIAVAFGYEDEITPSKIIADCQAEAEKLEILGGIINQQFVGPEYISQLAKLPSREELYGQLVGQVAAPIVGFVYVLKSNAYNLISVLKQYQSQLKT